MSNNKNAFRRSVLFAGTRGFMREILKEKLQKEGWDVVGAGEDSFKLYNPQITDFMLVVKRNQVGQRIPMNIMLVSQWTDQLDNIAFLLTEDDGGTRTEWKCSAVVKVKSKSYGFDVSLPFNSRDDIVWRGELSARYLEKYDGITSRFGDVDLTFSFLER